MEMIPSFQMGLTDEERSHLLDGIYDPNNNIGPRKNFPGDTFTQKNMYNFNQHFLDFSHRLIELDKTHAEYRWVSHIEKDLHKCVKNPLTIYGFK